jgi:hypothetical protein
VKTERPPCWNECAELFRRIAQESGTEMHVMVCPDVAVVGPYPPFICTCPHGITYMGEPTGEQIARWVEEKAP